MFRTMNCADCPAQEAAVLVMKDERMIIIEFLIHFLKLVKQRWTIHNCYVSLKYKYGEDKYSTSPLTSNFPFGRLWGSAKIILKFLIKQRTKFSIKYLKFMATSLRDGEESQIWTNRFGQLTITQAALAASGRNCKDEPSQAVSLLLCGANRFTSSPIRRTQRRNWRYFRPRETDSLLAG